MAHEIRIHLLFLQHAVHAFQNTSVNIARHIAEIGRNIAFHERAVNLTPLVVHFLHHPDAAGDGDLIPHRRRLHDGAEFFGTGAHRVLHVFLKHGVEFIVIDDALPGQADNQASVFRAVDVIQLEQVTKQNPVIFL